MGSVYKITLPFGMAIHNPNNDSEVPFGSKMIPEQEWLVPLHIPSQYVNNIDCGCG